MTWLKGFFLLAAVTLALLFEDTAARSPVKLCPRSYTVRGKCVKERRVTTTVHYGYDHKSGSCVKRQSRVVRRCGVESESACRCYISGDPHYVTFDGQNMHFFGKCTYVLTKPVNGASKGCRWSVLGKNRMRGGSPYTYLEEVVVNINGKAYRLTQKRRLYVGKVFQGLPYHAHKPDVMVQYMGNKILLHSRQCGIRVSFDGDAEAIIKVQSKYRNKLTGICGNCDGKRNDLRTASGRSVSGLKNKFTLIGNSYLAPGTSKTCSGPNSVRCSSALMANAKKACKKLVNSSSPFSRCMKRGGFNLRRYYTDCMQDMCAASHFARKTLIHEARCQSYAAAAEICASKGFPSKNWRSAARCPLKCPSGMRYEANRKTCQKTCESLFFGVNSCPRMRSEGCFCKPGLVLDGNLCVKKEDCRCLQCADLRSPSDCAGWKVKGRCANEPEVMYKYCRLTCNMCQKRKCVDLIATNTCLEKKREGKCKDSFYKEFCGLTCHWKSCQCPDEGSHYDRGDCESPRMVQKVTKTTVFRSVVTGVCTKASLFYYKPCGECEVINKIVEKKPCNYCTGQRVMEKIVQHRVGIYCTRRVKEFTKECTCAFRNGKVKYLHSIKCRKHHTKVFMYREKRVSKDCKRCTLIKTNKIKRIRCLAPAPEYNPKDKCPRGANSRSKYTRTICRAKPVNCACTKSCHSKSFDCSCDCLNPIGREDCEISRRCDRVRKRLVIRYKAEILVKDKRGDGVCTKRSAIIHSEKRPCNYKRVSYYTCDKDKSGSVIGCPTTKDKKWPPRWYNYKEGYLDDDCNCKNKNAKKVYQDNYCCCPKPYVIREPNDEYGTGKCEKADTHYRMLVVRISYVHNSDTGECVKQKSEWYEICRCEAKPERENCIDRPTYGLKVRHQPHCKLVDANTSNARCECGEKLTSRKVLCRKAPRYLQRKGKCDVKRGRAVYRRVYKEITYRKKCDCRTRVVPELEPCKDCIPKEKKEIIPCPKNCDNKMGRCSVNCKKYYVTYWYTWNNVSKTCVAKEVNRIPSRCCCKPYYRPPNGPGTDEKQEIGPVCHESGKYWKYYINRQHLCGKKYKKCCRKRIKRLVPIPCKVGRRKRAVHCSDGKNIKKFVFTRVFLKDCKCQKRVRVKPCKCNCPKSKSFVKCEHETNTYANVQIYYVIRNCRCHKQMNTKRRREPCEQTPRREVFNDYDACVAGKTKGWMYTRKFSRFYMKDCSCHEQKLETIRCHCKCPKKTSKTRERCNGQTGYIEWTVTKQKKAGCMCKPKTYKRKRKFSCPTQKDRIEVDCNKKTGVRITNQYNFRRIEGTCRCGWVKVDEREDRCNCDLENIKIRRTNKHNEKHPNCLHNRWHYETFEYYLTVRDGLSVCVQRSITGGRDVPCNRDESVLAVGKCNTRTRRQRYQKIWFELRACHCTKRSTYFYKPCGCPKDKPQKRKKVNHECDGKGNWILTWEFYRWSEDSQVCERHDEKQTRSVSCKPSKKQVSKTDCYKGHYQVTVHTSKIVEAKCTCKTDEKITVLPCVCPTITRTGKHCHEDPETKHSYREITTIIRRWNDKKERCEVGNTVVEKRICKCRKRIVGKPQCKKGNWITMITKFVMELNKNGDRVCTEVEKFLSKPKICNDQVSFETTKNKCENRRTDTIYYVTKKDVLRPADCRCIEREIKRTPCKCWCSDKRVFKYSRCQDDKVTVRYYSVERLEGCKCVKRQVRKIKTLSCPTDIVKRTRGPCNRRNKCTRPIYGWVNVAKNCRCVPRKSPDPIGHEKCDCCKKAHEVGEWFCKKKIFYRYVITRTWKPSKRKCLVVKTREARGVQCPKIKPKDRFVYGKCKKYRRVKYSLYMYLNPDSCACETKKKFVAIVWCKCPPNKREKICRKNKYEVYKVTVYTLRGENCEKSKSYSPPIPVRCVKPPKRPDGRGGKMNCLRIRYRPYAKVVDCKCHRGYKEEMEEYTTGVWCCKHRSECRDVSKPYCNKKSNTWFSTVSKCIIVNKQCVRRTIEKSGLTVTCSNKPIGKPSVTCDQKTKIEVTTTKYERPRNCECHTYSVTTTSVCGCNPPLKFVKNHGGYCHQDDTWVEEIVQKSWRPNQKICEETVINRRRRKIECVTKPVRTILKTRNGKVCFRRAGYRFRVKNVELKYYAAKNCHCVVVRKRTIQEKCDCPEDEVKLGDCDYKDTCMRRKVTVSFKAQTDDKGNMNCVPKSTSEKLRCCCNEKPSLFKYCDKESGHYITIKELHIFKPELLTCKVSKRNLVHPLVKCNKRFPAERSECRVDDESGIGYETITTRVKYLNKPTCECDTKTDKKKFVCSCPKCGKWETTCENNMRVIRRVCNRLIKPKSGEPYCQAQDEKRTETVPCSKKKTTHKGRVPKHCKQPAYQIITIRSHRLEDCKCVSNVDTIKKIRCCPKKTSKTICHNSGKYWVKNVLVWSIDRVSNNCSKKKLAIVISVPCTPFKKFYSPWSCSSHRKQCSRRPFNYIVKQWYRVRKCHCKLHREKRHKNMCCCTAKRKTKKCDCLAGRMVTKYYFKVLKTRKNRPNICAQAVNTKLGPKIRCQELYKAIPVGSCPKYKSGMKIPMQKFIIKRGRRDCCKCKVTEKTVKRPCHCGYKTRYSGSCDDGDTYRRVYLVIGTLRYDKSGLPSCDYKKQIFIGRDYCKCKPDEENKVLKNERCEGDSFLYTYEYEVMKAKCKKVSGQRMCINECIRKQITKRVSIKCESTGLIFRGNCVNQKRNVCKQIPYVKKCVCKHKKDCFKKEACDCKNSRKHYCDTKTNTKVTKFTTCKPVKEDCVCRVRVNKQRVVCDRPRTKRLIDCDVKRGYAFYHLDETTKRVPRSCTCVPKTSRKLIFCRCRKSHKSDTNCIDGRIWRSTITEYTRSGGKLGCVRRVKISDGPVPCPENPELVPGALDRKTCTRNNIVIYNELKACKCKKKSVRVKSRAINCCLQRGFSTPARCNKRKNILVTEHYRYVTSFNGYLFELGKVRIPTYKCVKTLARRTRKAINCPDTQVMESCNNKEGEDGVWTKTITTYRKKDCRCIHTVKVISGHCRCPISFIERRTNCVNNFRTLYWKMYSRRPDKNHKCPSKIVPKRERCGCNREERKSKKCDKRGNWVTTMYYKRFNAKLKQCEQIVSVISVVQAQCKENRYDVPSKNCSLKKTNCVKAYSDVIYTLNPVKCSCKKSVKVSKDRRCCCKKSSKEKKCVNNRFWKITGISSSLDEEEKCVERVDRSTIPVQCPSPYKIKGDCIGNRKSGDCGYRLVHQVYFKTIKCRCVKRQKTKKTLCSNYCELCRKRLKEVRRCNKKDGGKTYLTETYEYRLKRNKNKPTCTAYVSSKRLEKVECNPSRVEKSTYEKCGKKTGCKFSIYYYKMVPRNCKCIRRLLPKKTRRNLKCSCNCEKTGDSVSCRKNKYITFISRTYTLRKFRCKKRVVKKYKTVSCDSRPNGWVFKGKCVRHLMQYTPRIQDCKCSYTSRRLKTCKFVDESCCPMAHRSTVCVKNDTRIFYLYHYLPGCKACKKVRAVEKRKVKCQAPKVQLVKVLKAPDGSVWRLFRKTTYRVSRCRCLPKQSMIRIPYKCQPPKIIQTNTCKKTNLDCHPTKNTYGVMTKVFFGVKSSSGYPDRSMKCEEVNRIEIRYPCLCICPKKAKVCYKNKYWRYRVVKYIKNSRKCVRSESTNTVPAKPKCRRQENEYRLEKECPKSGFYTIMQSYHEWNNCKCVKRAVKIGTEICRCPEGDYKKVCNKAGKAFIRLTTQYRLCGDKLACCKRITKKETPVKCKTGIFRSIKCDQEQHTETVTFSRYVVRSCNCVKRQWTKLQPCVTCLPPRCRVGKKVKCIKGRIWKVQIWACHLYRKPGDWRKKCIQTHRVFKRPIKCKEGVVSKRTKCDPLTGEQLHLKEITRIIKCKCKTKTETKRCDCTPCKKSHSFKRCLKLPMRWQKTTVSWTHNGCRCIKHVRREDIPIPCSGKSFIKKSGKCLKKKSDGGMVGFRKVVKCRKHLLNCECTEVCKEESEICYCHGVLKTKKCENDNTNVVTTMRWAMDRAANSCVWREESVKRKVVKPCRKEKVKRSGCVYKSKTGGENYRIVKTTGYRHHECKCVNKPTKVIRETCDCDHRWIVIKRKNYGPKGNCKREYTLRRYVNKVVEGKVECVKDIRIVSDKHCCPKTRKSRSCDKQQCVYVDLITSYVLTGSYRKRFCQKAQDRQIDEPPCVRNKDITRIKTDRSSCRKSNYMRISYQRQICRNCKCIYEEYRYEKRVCRCNYVRKNCKCVQKGKKQKCLHIYERMSADRKRCIRVKSSYVVPVACGKRPKEVRVCNIRRKDNKGYVDKYYTISKYSRKWIFNKKRGTCKCVWKPLVTNRLCKCQPYKPEKPNDYFEFKRQCERSTNTYIVFYKKRIRRGNECVELIKQKKIAIKCQIRDSWRQLPDPPCPANRNYIQRKFEKGYKINCKCKVKRRVKACRCRCPKATLKQECHKDAILAISKSYKLINCKCIPVVKRRMRKMSCPKDSFHVEKAKSPKCTETRVRITFKKTACTKCTKKVERTVDHWCCPPLPPNMRKKVECDKENAIKVTRRFTYKMIGKTHPNRECKMTETKETQSVFCDNLNRPEKIVSSCKAKSGYTDRVRRVRYYTVEFNGEGCNCVWSRHYRWDVCKCRPDRTVESACNHKTCMQDILHYSYRMVKNYRARNVCRESVRRTKRRCGCCKKDYSKGPTCDGVRTLLRYYYTFRWNYKTRTCIKHRRVEKKKIECGEKTVVLTSRPNRATCTYTITRIRNSVKVCKCRRRIVYKKPCYFCCRPRKVRTVRCKNHNIIETTVAKRVPVGCKCVKAKSRKTIKIVKCKKRFITRCYGRNSRTCKQKCCKFECKVRNCKKVKPLIRGKCWHRVYKCCHTGISQIKKCDEKARKRVFTTRWHVWRPWRCDMHSKSREESVVCNQRLTVDRGACNIKGRRSGYLQEVKRKDIHKREVYAEGCRCKETTEKKYSICACKGYHDREVCTSNTLITYRQSWVIRQRSNGHTYCSPITTVITSRPTKCKKPYYRNIGSCKKNGMQTIQLVSEYADKCACQSTVTQFEMVCSCPKPEKDKHCEYERGRMVTTTKNYVKVCPGEHSCHCKSTKETAIRDVKCPKKTRTCHKGLVVTITHTRRGCECITRRTEKSVSSCTACTDIVDHCSEQKRRGYCESNKETKETCKETCGFCNVKPCPKPKVVQFKPQRGISIKSDRKFNKYFYIRTLENKKESACIRACRESPNCRSFDYDRRSRSCVLNRVRIDDIQTRGYTWVESQQKSRYSVHYNRVCQDECECKVKPMNKGKCVCRGTGVERWCARRFAILQYHETNDGRCVLGEDSRYVVSDCDETCIDIGKDCAKNKHLCGRDIVFSRRCDRTCRKVCRCGEDRKQHFKGLCTQRTDGKWTYYKRIVRYHRTHCNLCEMAVEESYEECTPEPCDETEIKVVGDCIKGVKLISIYSRKRHRDGSCPVTLVRVVKEDCTKCCKEIMKDVGRCQKYKDKGGYYRPVTHSWYVKRKGNCELKMEVRWFPCSKIACPRDFTTNGKCEFGRRLTYNVFYTVDGERNCVRHAKAYKTYCKQKIRPECNDAYIDLLSPRQCLKLKKKGMCMRNEGASLCARTCNFCVVKKFCTKKMGPVDLILTVDASDSTELVTFENYVVPFLRSIVGKMGRSVRASVIQYGSSPKTVFKLGEEVYPRNMMSRINHMDMSGGSTYTARALYAASEEFRLRGRRSAHKVSILVTDGRNSGKMLIKPAVKRLKRYADTSIVIGIGHEVSESEMRLIASDYASDEIRLSNFRQLAGIVDKVVRKICPKGGKPIRPKPGPKPKPRPTPRPKPGPKPGPKPRPGPQPKPKPSVPTYGIDLYFVVDSSSSVTEDEFTLIKQFIKSYVNSIVISPEDTRVSIIQYWDKVTTTVDIEEYRTVNDLLPAIENMKYFNGQRTVLGDALDLTSKRIARNDRNVPKVVIVISGTPPTNGEAIKEAAPKLIYYADKVITIGIKDRMPRTELLLISSTTQDTIIIEQYTKLHDTIPKIIEKTKISERKKRPAPSGTGQDIVFIVDSSDSIGQNNWNMYIKGLLKVITEYVIVSPSDTRFALIQFSKPAQVVFGFNDFTDGESLRRAINKLKPYHRSTYPSIGNALKVAVDYVKTKKRTGVPTSAIIITSSTSSPRVGRPVEEVITEVQEVFDYIIPVAVRSRVDLPDLEKLAKPDSSMIITTEELDELIPLSKRIISLTTVRLRRRPVVCRKRSRGDFIFVIGVSSRTAKNRNFEKIKYFIKKIASKYEIDEGASRGGVFILGSSSRKEVGLNMFRSDVDFKASINRLSTPKSYTTHFRTGMERIVRYVRRSRTKRRPTTMIYISDGSEMTQKVYSVAPRLASSVRKTIVVGIKPTIRRRALLRTMVTDVRHDFVNVRRFRDLKRVAGTIAGMTCTRTGKATKVKKTEPGVKRIVMKESKRSVTENESERPKRKTNKRKIVEKKHSKKRQTVTVKIEGQGGRRRKQKTGTSKKIPKKNRRKMKKKISVVYGTTIIRGAPQRYIKKIKFGKRWFKTRVIRVTKGHGKRRRARRYLQIRYRKQWIRFDIKKRRVQFRRRWYKIRFTRRGFFVRISRKWRMIQTVRGKSFVSIRGKKYALNNKKRRPRRTRKHRHQIRIRYTTKVVKNKKVRVPSNIKLGVKKVPVKVISKRVGKNKEKTFKTLIRIGHRWVRFSSRQRRVRIGKGWFRVTYRREGPGVVHRRRWYKIKVTKKGFKIRVARKWRGLITTGRKLYIQYRGKITRVGKPLVVRSLHGKFRKGRKTQKRQSNKKQKKRHGSSKKMRRRQRKQRRTKKSQARHRRRSIVRVSGRLPIRIRYTVKKIRGKKIRVPKKIRLGKKVVRVKVQPRTVIKRGKRVTRNRVLVRIQKSWHRFSVRRRKIRVGKMWVTAYYKNRGLGIRYKRKWIKTRVTKRNIRVRVSGKWRPVTSKKNKLYITGRNGKRFYMGIIRPKHRKGLKRRTTVGRRRFRKNGRGIRLPRRINNKRTRVFKRRLIKGRKGKKYATGLVMPKHLIGRRRSFKKRRVIKGRKGKKYATGLVMPKHLRGRRRSFKKRRLIKGRKGKKYATGLVMPKHMRGRRRSFKKRRLIKGRKGKKYATGLVMPKHLIGRRRSFKKRRVIKGRKGKKYATGLVMPKHLRGRRRGASQSRLHRGGKRSGHKSRVAFVKKRWYRTKGGVIVENGRRIVLNRFGKMRRNSRGSSSHRKVRRRSSRKTVTRVFSSHGTGRNASGSSSSSMTVTHSHSVKMGKPEVYDSGWISSGSKTTAATKK